MRKIFISTLVLASLLILIACPLALKSLKYDLYFTSSYQDQKHYGVEIRDTIRKILSTYDRAAHYPEIKIVNPYDKSLFPRDIASPTFTWKDSTPDSKSWLIIISFKNNGHSIYVLSGKNEWTPEDKNTWEIIKANSRESSADVTVLGISGCGEWKITAKGGISISTSEDKVESPILFQQIPLPFAYARRHPKLSRWCIGDVSSYEKARIILKNLPVCGFCHSLSRDGKTFGMDIDYKRDKGAYVLAPVMKYMALTRDNIISWNDIPVTKALPNMGLFSKISPDGKYVISTINEKPFMAIIDDLYFSQLFFPVTGYLAYYSREDKSFHLLPGADDPDYIHTSPAWSPDGKTIVFSRAGLDRKLIDVMGNSRLLKIEPDVRIDDLNKKYRIQFDLCRIPFNNGKGGTPEPLAGACSNGKSNYFPRFSPDGKWIVFNQSDTGLVAQPGSELYIIPAEGGIARKMKCNTDLFNSWHSWSPNGKWVIFTSKVNTPYTQLFITHIDENGNDSPPVLLSRFSSPKYASILPEFANIKPDTIQGMMFFH